MAPPRREPVNDSLTAVPGFSVGHWTHAEGTTGCTVVLCPELGVIASGALLGAAPASREAVLLDPRKTVQSVHAVVISGGSAFGLSTADGVMRWLVERDRGLPTPGGLVPLVPTACLYDLTVSGPLVRPDAQSGYLAADAAHVGPVQTGRVGAGAGATAGKYLGPEAAVRTGLGSASATVRGAVVGAIAVPNPALGDIYSLDGQRVVAGHGRAMSEIADLAQDIDRRENTTLVVVATDAKLTKGSCGLLALSAHAGIARVTRPSHTPYDGDTVFMLSSGAGPEVGIGALAVAIQDVVARAIVQAGQGATAA